MTEAPAAPQRTTAEIAASMFRRSASLMTGGEQKPAATTTTPPAAKPATEAPTQDTEKSVAERMFAKTAADEEAKAEGEAEKKREAVQSGYADFKLPENFALDPETAKTVTPLLKKLGAGQQHAQAIVDAGVALVTKNQKALVAEHQKEIGTWRRAAEAEFGPNLSTEVGHAKHVIASALPDAKQRAEFNALLNASGLGSHPHMIRVLAAAGKAMRGR